MLGAPLIQLLKFLAVAWHVLCWLLVVRAAKFAVRRTSTDSVVGIRHEGQAKQIPQPPLALHSHLHTKYKSQWHARQQFWPPLHVEHTQAALEAAKEAAPAEEFEEYKSFCDIEALGASCSATFALPEGRMLS